MNVTDVPAQIVDAVADMETLAATEVVTVIVTVFDVAGDPVTHAAFEVITQVMTSPFAKDEVEYVALFVPTFDPFLFHW